MNGAGPSILIAGDHPEALVFLRSALETRFEDVRAVATGGEALLAIERRSPDLLFLDLGLPDVDGLEVLAHVVRRWPTVRVVCVHAAAEPATIVEAVRGGASDYLVKPVGPEAILAAAGRALCPARAVQAGVDSAETGIVGDSYGIVQARRLVRLAARADLNVLICGETGTGKELVARAVHQAAGHAPESFVPFNCATTPPELFDSILFGHRRGSFTGADRDHPGILQRADGRTLFLDELESLGPPQQAKLLRVLDDGEFRPIGGDLRHVSVRFLAATNRDPAVLMREGSLRADLYHRLRGIEIALPPLRHRLEDIPRLARCFLRNAEERLSWSALARLANHHWPGNVRELRQVLRAADLYSDGGIIGPEQILLAPEPFLPHPLAQVQGQGGGRTLAAIEADAISDALRLARGRRGLAARTLGIDRSTLRRKIRSLGS